MEDDEYILKNNGVGRNKLFRRAEVESSKEILREVGRAATAGNSCPLLNAHQGPFRSRYNYSTARIGYLWN